MAKWTAGMFAACVLAGCATQAPIALKEIGSFHIGGREVTISGRPVKEVLFTPGGVPAKVDPNGVYMAEQMYVQYFIPHNTRGTLPLLMWHGGGLTGVTYETTPDGREGWLQYFLKKGWSVYNSDAVERGRASWAMYPDIIKGEPVFLTKENPWDRFRIGAPGSYSEDPAKRKAYPGQQFPIEAYEQFTKQVVPRWTTTDDATIAAYTALVDKVCPCVVLIHSQGGLFGYRVAQARPDKVKALIAVEPANAWDVKLAPAFRNTPMLAIYGDYIEQNARWQKIRAMGVEFVNAVNAVGGKAEAVDLPKVGIRGNSHMVMMDRNSDEVAAFIQSWLERQGLYR